MVTAKRNFFILTLGSMLLLLTACGSFTAATTTTSSQPVAQVLQNSSAAMKQVKSAHVEMNTNTTVQTTLSTQDSTQNQNPLNISLNLAANGDIAQPNQSSLEFTLGQNSLGLQGNYSIITTGDKLYIKNAKSGQWYVMDKNSMKNSSTNTPTSIPDMTKLLNAAQQSAKSTDHGTESLNGENLHHITVTLDKNGIQQILTNDSQLSSQIGQKNIDQWLNNMKSFQGSIDFWIDDATSYVHRTEVKINLDMDVNSLFTRGTPTTTSSSQSNNIKLTLDSTVDLSKFNDPVTITAPANAVPTTNPISIFGIGG